MGKLYVVSTPIGNLEDITFRGKKILSEVRVVACEDTRKTGLLLKNIGISPKPQLLSYYEENELHRIPQIISYLKEGKDVALVSNAGTPTISDPGFKLVRECIKNKIEVISIPGASALLAALVCSGLPTDKFIFLGYLPKKSGKKIKVLKNLATVLHSMVATVVIYESPYRILKTLTDLRGVFGDIEIVIGRELTKLHEEKIRGKISEVVEHFEEKRPKGELTLLFYLSNKRPF